MEPKILKFKENLVDTIKNIYTKFHSSRSLAICEFISARQNSRAL